MLFEITTAPANFMKRTSTPIFTLVVMLLSSLYVPASAGQTQELTKNCATLSAVGHYPDYGPTPKYSIQRRQYDTNRPPILHLQLSASPDAIDGSRVIRLACKLDLDFPKENAIDALIFDDERAARNLTVGFTDQDNYVSYLWHLRAHYVLNRQNKEHFIEYLLPMVDHDLLGLLRIKVTLTSD
jgi:hypothetical protein